MLHHDRINISKGVDLTKSNNSNECMICHYRFFNHGFEFQDSVWDGCHDLTMLSVNVSDIAIITVKNFAYRCISHNIIKSEAINILKNLGAGRSWVYVKNIILNFSLLKTVFFNFYV